MDTVTALTASDFPRPGTSRRAQNKRTLHARFLAGAVSPKTPAAKRLKLPVRRAATAPTKAVDIEMSDTSDLSSHTTDGETLNKASSCPPLRVAVLPTEAEPLTPRIVPLLPAAAAPADSKSPLLDTPPAGAASASSESAPVPAAVADTAATEASALSPQLSAATHTLEQAPLVPPVGLAPISAPMAFTATAPPQFVGAALAGSPPATPNVTTPPPETPKVFTTKARGRGRAGSAEPRAGGYKGRFCGRLFLKEDEVKLANECQLLGPLLGCYAAPGEDPNRHTLAKIVRGIASGAVRAHCQQREAQIQELEAQLAAQQLATRQAARRVAMENQAMRAQLGLLNKSHQALATAQRLLPTSAPPPSPVKAAASTAAPPVSSPGAPARTAATLQLPAIPMSAALAAAEAASRAAALAASKAVAITAPAAMSPAPAAPAFRAPPPRLPSSLPAATAAAGGFSFSSNAFPAIAPPQSLPLAAFNVAAAGLAMATAAATQQPVRQQPVVSAPQQLLQLQRGPPPPVATRPMMSPFGSSPRSAFAPVVPGKSPLAAGSSIMRPVPSVGVPQLALQPPART